ncbi:MAG: class II fructose-bisphosphate aldolase [Armatimonadetes bacterium]|nr:class II fructose-bisphosphate aldolase [Armatimonadota bacterium]
MPSNRSDRLARLMRAAAENGIAVPAFNVPYLPLVRPICEALERHGAFGLVEVARLELYKFESRSLAAVAEEYDRWANRRNDALHLDHVPVIDEDNLAVDYTALIAEGIALGYDSVMVDGSRLAFEGNIDAAAQVVAMAHPEGVLVEAELGAVLGHESGPMPPYDELFATKRGFTEADQARVFVEKSGVDWLSVSVGSVHGAIAPSTKGQTKVTARLDVERVSELRVATGVPLVLHGGSGIAVEYLRAAIGAGMAKVNVATDIRQPYERALAAGGSLADGQSAAAQALDRLLTDVLQLDGSLAMLQSLIGERS